MNIPNEADNMHVNKSSHIFPRGHLLEIEKNTNALSEADQRKDICSSGVNIQQYSLKKLLFF